MAQLKWMLCNWLFLTVSMLAVQSINAQKMGKINWPPNYEPSKSKFFVHNEIEIEATPEEVWQILIDAESWATFYKGAQNVKIQDTSQAVLQANSVFRWKTMGLQFDSYIREFVPNSRLSWESKRSNIQGYHAWLIVPQANGCRLITDESQNGWLTFFEKLFQPRKLKKLHDVWLVEIKKKAESATKNKLR